MIFDTWDSGSPRLGCQLFPGLWYWDLAAHVSGCCYVFGRGRSGESGPGPLVRASLLVRARILDHRDLVCARDQFQSRLQFISSVVFPSHPPGDVARCASLWVSLLLRLVSKSEAFAGWCWCVWASGVGSTSTPRPRGQCLVQPFHPHPRLFQLGVYWRQLLVSGPECMLLLGTASWAAGRDELR